MEHFYREGKIVLQAKLYEPAYYNVSNEQMCAVFDGKGATVAYTLANEEDYVKDGFIVLQKNGIPVDIYAPKSVEMCGRCQTVRIDLGHSHLTIRQFLDKTVNGVFTSYTLESTDETDSLDLGVFLFASKVRESNEIAETASLTFEKCAFSASLPFRYVGANREVTVTLRPGIPFRTFLSCGEEKENAESIVGRFSHYEQSAEEEILSVEVPKGLSEEETALYYSTYFCSLQNYKVKGNYKAFMAGHHYLLPMRSYYRDSYFTVLPMYRGHTDKVRDQILTLAHGISEDGNCPSAVKFDFSEWWGNHFDSPSFLAMMLYDYVRCTGDETILSAPVKDTTVLTQAIRAMEALSQFTDETGLLYKEGPYNRRDWADEVNRTGYVTYNELLYARALESISNLLLRTGNRAEAERYRRRFETVKSAINTILWDDTLGYYVNFKTKNHTETNLSVDTVFAAIFGIADDARAVRMLQNMERLLESKNNREQRAGDYGVMCVYPFYTKVDSAIRKSSQPYYYHNGANWPYLSAMYAYAKRKYGMEYRYALESWFNYNVLRGNYTPIEFFSPPQKDGSLLQGWCGACAFVLDEALSKAFWAD